MTKPRIITQVSDAWGTTVVLYEAAGQYGVGTLSSHLLLIPLPEARYPTFNAADERLRQELQERRVQRARVNT